MATHNHITLKNSNNTLIRHFDVLSEGYDDGTPNRPENIKRTIIGTLDHSVGRIYKTWDMTVRVRDTETRTHDGSPYGTKADLETFYNYNNPNGTPSMNITLVDHHGDTYTAQIQGKLNKSLLGCEISGVNAWYIYKLSLIEVLS